MTLHFLPDKRVVRQKQPINRLTALDQPEIARTFASLTREGNSEDQAFNYMKAFVEAVDSEETYAGHSSLRKDDHLGRLIETAVFIAQQAPWGEKQQRYFAQIATTLLLVNQIGLRGDTSSVLEEANLIKDFLYSVKGKETLKDFHKFIMENEEIPSYLRRVHFKSSNKPLKKNLRAHGLALDRINRLKDLLGRSAISMETNPKKPLFDKSHPVFQLLYKELIGGGF